jgi:hypothetical protein
MTWKRQYLNLCLTMPAGWLRASTADPGPHMTRTHVAIARIALRRLEAI